ncbi:zinc-dependent metalloprotease [Photobacterium sanguinicancri]|uniref:zinc-dependent metalloprotease n=2 Tax=Gammaproteobacteria TaxID=1236 RepID=UPI0026E3A23E|nr:zinc-dependent metalloprotease [Photobacterium sanguinicancri]MDO6500399.1 zinc-dependent metalloprotease [Photobacterium sanguinicancri]
MKRSLAASSIISALFLAGCGADDQSYDLVERDPQQVTKRDIKTDQVYLYMPSMAKAPRYAVSMAPFMQGQEKLVRFFYTEEGLEVRQLSPDVISQAQINNNDFGRWSDIDTNLSPLLKLPGTYQDYRCKEDAYDDCTNKEEENKDDDVSWKDKKFFTPDYTKLAVLERDWDDLFTYSTGCYTAVGPARLATDWEGYELKDGALNIELEQDYQISNKWNCLVNALFQGNDGLDFNNLTFTVSNFYSFVPLDAVQSQDYEPVLYPKGDEDTFGMFASQVSRPDHLGNNTQDGNRIHYMHRFNPTQATVDYHLSDSFNVDPTTQFYKQITLDVIERINPQLTKVGVPAITLHEPSGKRSGDLRYNVINLIHEPLQNGLAGYGPSAVNPVTGEIVHAHVNQYSGVLESIAHRLWDRIAIQYNQGNVQPMPIEEGAFESTEPVTFSHSASSGQLGESSADLQGAVISNTLPPAAQTLASEPLENALKALNELNKIPQDTLTPVDLIKINELEKRLWAEHNMFPVSSLWSSTTEKMLPTMIVAGQSIDFTSEEAYVWADNEKTQLKGWDGLTIEQQTHVGRILAGIYYAKTLVHEIGHNLGLRHNFQGSNDDTNFFTKQQAHNHGLKYIPAYSSIMDYNPSMMDALPVFGLYDKAALRFAYKRQVEISTFGAEPDPSATSPEYFSLNAYDKELKAAFFAENSHLDPRLSDGVLSAAVNDAVLDDKWSDKVPGDKVLREFKYCTDGNVSLNTDCNRHDEGRNHSEINDYNWQRYYEHFPLNTQRNNRKNFDESTLSDYAIGRVNAFMNWRENIQMFDRMSQYIGWSDADRLFIAKTDPVCTGQRELWPVSDFNFDYFCGMAQGIDELRNNLVNIVIQPDHQCEVQDTTGEISYHALNEVIYQSAVRSQLDQGEVPRSCFHPAVESYLTNQGQTVLAEAGKMLNSGKAPNVNPKFNYVGMFDYYGFWPDKFAAMAALLERDGIRRTTDRTDSALVDLPYIIPTGGNGYIRYDLFKTLLDDIALGTNNAPTLLDAELFRDRQGKAVAPQGEFTIFEVDTKVEATPYYAKNLKRFYNLPHKGEYSLIEALLKLVVQFSDSQTGYYTNGDQLAQYVSLRSSNDHVSQLETFVRQNGQSYYAGPANGLALQMIQFINELNQLLDPSIDNNTLELKHITLTQFDDSEQQPKLFKLANRYQQVLEILPLDNR